MQITFGSRAGLLLLLWGNAYREVWGKMQYWSVCSLLPLGPLVRCCGPDTSVAGHLGVTQLLGLLSLHRSPDYGFQLAVLGYLVYSQYQDTSRKIVHLN